MRPHPSGRTGVASAALAVLAFVVGCGTPPAPDPVPTVPSFGLAGDRFYNAESGYSVAIPGGWTLRPASDVTLVVFDRDGTPAAFSVLALPPGDSAVSRVEATIANFEGSGASAGIERVERDVGDGPTAVAARGFVGRGASGTGRLVLRMLGADGPAGRGYVLVFESTPEADEATADERAAILGGFRPLDGDASR